MQDRKIRGWYVVLGGIVFAILPLSVALIASIFVDDAFNEGSSDFGTYCLGSPFLLRQLALSPY
jgi:hypothetical protein